MLSAFFLAMTIYPEVFKKAQAEVDSVVGNERLPTMEDRDALPYVNAICTELLRWNVLIPLRTYLRACAFPTRATLYDTTSITRHYTRYHLRRIFYSPRVVASPERLVRGLSVTASNLRSHPRNPCCRFILSHPETYPDPDVFKPERFLGNDQQPDPRQACFGWGRRSCLGARLAESTIFIYVAMALATMDVSRCVENGVELVPRYEFEEEMIR